MPNEYIMTPEGRREMTDEEQAKINASRVKGIEEIKQEIEAKTQELLAKGLEYPAGSGVMHSLTDERLAKYNAAKARQSMLSYPRRFKASNGHIIVLKDDSEFSRFDGSLTLKYQEIVDGELDLLEKLYKASTQEEIDAIKDNR